MTYGLGTRVFSEFGPAAKAAGANATPLAPLSWRALDEERRFALIERALKPANDLIDAYPLAL